MDENQFIKLPNEIFLKICTYLSAKQVICSLGLVCKHFNKLIKDDFTWQHRLFTKFLKPFPPVPLEDLNWMQACIEREEKYEQLSNFEKKMKHFSLNAHAYGHIDCLKLFENANYCVSGARDGSLAVWDIKKLYNHESFQNNDVTDLSKSGLFIKYLNNAHKGWVWTVNVFENQISSGSWDRTIKIRDLNADMKDIRTLNFNSALLCHSFNKNSIIAGSLDRKIYLFDLRENQSKPSSVLSIHHGAVVNLKVKNDILVSAGEDKQIFINDLRMTNNSLKTIQLESVPLSMCYKFNQLWIGDKKVHLYDANNNQFNHIDTFDFGHESRIRGLVYTLGALITCSKDKTLKFSEPNLNSKCFNTIKFDRELSALEYLNSVIAVSKESSIEFFLPRN